LTRLAIFGDSYADLARPQNLSSDFCQWHQLLEPYDVTVHAASGASNGWILSEFLRLNERADRVVVFVTRPHRLYMPVRARMRDTGESIQFEHWAGVSQVAKRKNYTLGYDSRLIEFIESWFVYMQSRPLSDQLALAEIKSMISLVKTTRQDAILVPVDHVSVPMIRPYSWGMMRISEHEFKANLNQDPRPNHMSQASHEWFSQHILARLRGDWLEWQESSTPSFGSFDELMLNLGG